MKFILTIFQVFFLKFKAHFGVFQSFLCELLFIAKFQDFLAKFMAFMLKLLLLFVPLKPALSQFSL